jgi:hypothetical protein
MSTAEDLGKLIMMMNPYTHGSDDSMEPHTFVAAPAAPGSLPTSLTNAAPDSTCIWMEMDTRYPGEWTFKGQPHHVNTALRIAYRWAKKDESGKFICWITDYLLIGYEGSNGG